VKPIPKKLRSRAEKLLATTRRDASKLPVDVQKLVHELQVHQIELEMQNGELRRTQLELEVARERLQVGYDTAPVGFLTLDAQGVIQAGNLTARALLNFDLIKLRGQKFTRFIAPESQDVFYQCRRQLLNTGEKQSCELHLLRTSSPLFIARLEMVMERTGPELANCCLVMMSDITEQKRADEVVRESAARLATFAEATFEGIVESEAGRILDCNEQYARMVGRTVEELKGMEIADLIAPEDRERVMANIAQGKESAVEHVMFRKDGTRIVVEAHGRPIPGTKRRHSALRDVTARKQADAALQQAHDQLEQRVRERTQELTCANTALRGEKAFSDSLIELAPTVIAVMDGLGNLIRTNAYAEQLTGYPFAETEGRNMISLFVPKEEQPRVRRVLREALQGRAVQQVVAPLRTRDGSIRHIEWVAKPLANAEGKLTAMLAIGHDITERKQAEEALRRSEHHLANFFDQAPIGMAWLSASGTILRANQAQLDLLGCAPEDYLGHSFLEFCTDASHGRELLERLAKKETVRNLRMTRQRKDGTIRHVLVDANSFWSDSQFQYSSLFLRDITDRVSLEREILHVSEREHRRIAQDLHDGLGQLLVGTVYLANTLQKDLAAKSIPEARRLSRIMEVLNEAIWQTRNLSRGLHPVEPEPNGLMAALEALAVRTKKLFHVPCHFKCRRPVLVHDNAVATHLFRIAQEAVTNAIKHASPGRIVISLTETPGRVCLAVNDDGSGLPARRRKPAGMGLRIMRYRAGMIGGSVAVQNELGGGTTVVCTVHLAGDAAKKPVPMTTRKKTLRKH
jgi:PAS domain S-box-containing protein